MKNENGQPAWNPEDKAASLLAYVEWLHGEAVRLFLEDGTHGQILVDWLKREPGGRWEAVNLDDIETWGIATEARLDLSADTGIGADLLALAKRCDTDFHASRYAMDYPDAEAGLTVRHRFTRDLLLRVRQGVSNYAGNRARAHDDWFLSTGAELQWRLPAVEQATFNAGVSNLLDDDFQHYPGQEPAGRRFYASITFSW